MTVLALCSSQGILRMVTRERDRSTFHIIQHIAREILWRAHPLIHIFLWLQKDNWFITQSMKLLCQLGARLSVVREGALPTCRCHSDPVLSNKTQQNGRRQFRVNNKIITLGENGNFKKHICKKMRITVPICLSSQCDQLKPTSLKYWNTSMVRAIQKAQN